MAATLVALVALTTPATADADPVFAAPNAPSTTASAPVSSALTRVLLLRDYNTRVVMIGTTLLGLAAGVIGTFAYLRKRAMLGDALSHATLPGIAITFILTTEKQLPLLLLGATITGIVGVLAVTGMQRIPRIKEDAAIGIVLSVFFGVGMVLFSIVQQMQTGEAAGLQSFIYGKAAAMLRSDAILIGATALIVLIGCTVLFKEFRAVCFDPAFAAAQGWPVLWIDLWMMALVVLTTVVGLQAVGLILVVALLIIPAAAARFWTDRLLLMTVLAGGFGAASGYLGAGISALAPRLPTGAIIVITAGAFFTLSMLLAPHRGVIAALLRRISLAERVANQHLLRAMAEFEERHGEGTTITFDDLLACRSWSAPRLRQLIRRMVRRGILTQDARPRIQLTPRGRIRARRVLRNHRLWEMYLIQYADIAPSHVDRDADEIEHVLSPGVVRQLERTLDQQRGIPPSPHPQEVHA